MADLPNLTVEPTTDRPIFDGIAEMPRIVPVRRTLTGGGEQLRVGKSTKATHARYMDALSAVAPGGTVTGEADFVTDESILLPNKGATDKHIELVGEPGATLLAPDAGGSITTAPGAHHYHIAGFKIRPNVKNAYGLVTIGAGTRTQADQPHDIIIDRIDGRVDALVDFCRRGLFIIGRAIQVLDSAFTGYNDANNSDSQGILFMGGDGQSLIDGCELSAVSESLMFGGGDTPFRLGDVTVRRSRLFKDPAWIGRDECGMVKNLLELKTGTRIRLEDLILAHCWNAATGWQGLGVALKSVSQDGTMPHAETSHVSMRRVDISGVGAGFGLHPNPESQKRCVPMAFVSIKDVNLHLDTTRGSGKALNIGGKMTDLEFRSNTAKTLVGRGGVCVQAGEGGYGMLERVHVTQNAFDMPGANPLQGDSFGYVDNNLENYWDSSCSFEGNEFKNIGPSRYSSPRALRNTYIPEDGPISVPVPDPTPTPEPDPMAVDISKLDTAISNLRGETDAVVAAVAAFRSTRSDSAAAQAAIDAATAEVEKATQALAVALA